MWRCPGVRPRTMSLIDLVVLSSSSPPSSAPHRPQIRRGSSASLSSPRRFILPGGLTAVRCNASETTSPHAAHASPKAHASRLNNLIAINANDSQDTIFRDAKGQVSVEQPAEPAAEKPATRRKEADDIGPAQAKRRKTNKAVAVHTWTPETGIRNGTSPEFLDVDSVELDAVASTMVAPKAPRKKKADGTAKQPRARGAKITKPRNRSKETTKAPRAKATSRGKEKGKVQDVTSLDKPVIPPEDAQESRSDVQVTLGLDEAIRRRRNWTPLKEDRNTTMFMAEAVQSDTERSQVAPFRGILDGFMRPSDDTSQNSAASASTSSKRQTDSFTNSRGRGRKAAGKSPVKKKPQTITALATAQFVRPTTPDLTRTEPPREGVLVSQDPNLSIGAPDRDEAPTKGSGKKIRKKKPTDKPRKSRAQRPPKEETLKILSPQAFGRSLANQNFLFGTSSQLAEDNSPRTIRQIQQAITDSETSFRLQACTSANTSVSARLQRVAGGELWRASARNEANKLLEREVERAFVAPAEEKKSGLTQSFELLDFQDIDEFDERLLEVDEAEPQHSPNMSAIFLKPLELPGFQDIDLLDAPPMFKAITIGQAVCDAPDVSTEPHLASFQDIDLLDATEPSKDTVNHSAPPGADGIARPTDPFNEQPVSSSPKKTSKPRGRPRKVLSTQASTTPLTPTKAKSHKFTTKVNRGGIKPTVALKPITELSPRRHLSQESWLDIDEIQDSDAATQDESPLPELTAALEADDKMKNSSGPKTKRKGAATTGKSLAAKKTSSQTKRRPFSWSNLDPAVFPLITTAVRSTPPSSTAATTTSSSSLTTKPTPMNLTWHERILLYDPLDIDKFTNWLNYEKKLRCTWEGKQIRLQDWVVRKWCEDRGVCVANAHKIVLGNVRREKKEATKADATSAGDAGGKS